MPAPMSVDHASKLQELLARLAQSPTQVTPRPELETAPSEPMTDPVCQELVWAYLVWEAGQKRATALAAKLCDSFVDLNELRVCLPSELAAFFGSSYPKASERAERLRASLNDVYRREHSVSLASLSSINKREARAYLESIEGIPPYVASRTLLLGLGGHAFPLDERLSRVLVSEEALAEAGDLCAAATWLERQIRSGDAAKALHALEALAETAPVPSAPEGKAPRRPSKKSDTPRSRGGKATPS